MKRVVCASLAAALMLVASASFAQTTVRPVDEAATRPDFFSFRAQLQAAIARRDVDALLRVVDPNIKASFGGDEGIEDFRRMWTLGDPATSELWGVLGSLLALGGTFDAEGRFTAPYVFSRWPAAFDSFTHAAIIGDEVRVRAEPQVDARTLGAVSFGIVEVIEPSTTDQRWVHVRVPGIGVGFIDQRFVRSPIAFRAFFEKVNGSWRLTLLVAGD